MMLTAKHAVCSAIANVSEETRPCDLGPGSEKYLGYAVFTNLDSVFGPRGFLGMVSLRRVNQFPLRIFSDLLPTPAIVSVEEHTPLSDIVERFDLHQIEMLPVINSKQEYLGAVTRQSLLEVLLKQERENINKLQREVEKGKRVQAELVRAMSMLDQRIPLEHLENVDDLEPLSPARSTVTVADERDQRWTESHEQAYITQLLNVSRFKLSQVCRIVQSGSASERLVNEIEQILQELTALLSRHR